MSSVNEELARIFSVYSKHIILDDKPDSQQELSAEAFTIEMLGLTQFYDTEENAPTELFEAIKPHLQEFDTLNKVQRSNFCKKLLPIINDENSSLQKVNQAFMFCVNNNLLHWLDFFIDFGAEINAKNIVGYSALHIAAEDNNTPLLDKLLQINQRLTNKQKIKINLKLNSGGDTALHIAAAKGYYNIVRKLLKNGAKREKINKKGFTPYYLAYKYNRQHEMLLDLKERETEWEDSDCEWGDESEATIKNDEEELEIIIPLIECVKKNDTQGLINLLKDHKVNPDESDAEGNTALHRAAFKGDVTSANIVLSYSAQVNVRNHSQQTPLHSAVIKNYLTPHRDADDIIDVLLDKKAAIDAQDSQLMTALHYAAYFRSLKSVCALLRNKANVVLLDAAGKTAIDYLLSLDDFDETAFHMAVIKEEHELLALFLALGMCPTIQNTAGKTVFDVALEKENYPALVMLLKAYPDEKILAAAFNKAPTAYKEEFVMIYAKQAAQKFIDDNHLMGKGSLVGSEHNIANKILAASSMSELEIQLLSCAKTRWRKKIIG